MSRTKQILHLVSVAVVVLLCGAEGHGQPNGTSLDHITGVSVYDSTKIPVGRPISFYIRLNNQSGHWFACPSHGFKLWSPDGATWNPHMYVDTNTSPFGTSFDSTLYGRWENTAEMAPLTWLDVFDGGLFILPSSGPTDDFGAGADTTGFIGFAQAIGTGLFEGLNYISYSITLDSVDQSAIGSTMCLDSSYYEPSGIWFWVNGMTYVTPWDGPHCFEIVDCCLGRRGNMNGSYDDQIDISDLNTYVSWAYLNGPAPPCMGEVDINGDGGINTADLSYIVAYMFGGGPPPAMCQ